MTPATLISSVAVPLMRDNIDTDAIIPSREIKTVGKTGLSDGLFAGWRYLQIGGREPDPAFVLNNEWYRDSSILLAGQNFGCGSSREHAVWALAEYGFKAIIAPSFNPIFYSNCVRNGIIPVEFDSATLHALDSDPPGEIRIDLAEQSITMASGQMFHFPIDEESRAILLGGLDSIDLTLQRADEIAAFRECDRIARPWIYLEARR